MPAVKALVSLCISTGSPESSLLGNRIKYLKHMCWHIYKSKIAIILRHIKFENKQVKLWYCRYSGVTSYMYIVCAYWVIFHDFLLSANFFKIIFLKTFSRNTIRMSNSLDPDQAQHFVGPDLDPNCLQSLTQ